MLTIYVYTIFPRMEKRVLTMSLEVPGYDIDRNLGFVISDLHRLITTAMDKKRRKIRDSIRAK